jgi:probable rRNA maturation factor
MSELAPEIVPDIDIVIEAGDWQSRLPAAEETCLTAARLALSHAEGVPDGPATLTLILADNETVQALNRDYRGKDQPTNVLSFALYADTAEGNPDSDPDQGPDEPDADAVNDGSDDGDDDGADEEHFVDPDMSTEMLAQPGPVPIVLGDVFLAFETVDQEAREQRKPFADHLSHLVIHGVLHLLGYDHLTDADADRMERLESDILARLGIADPYAGQNTGAPDQPGRTVAPS